MSTIDERAGRTVPVSDSGRCGPILDFVSLDTLWLQITGTICNLACTHCFITCGPKNDSHPFMEFETVLDILDEAEEHGLKEVYFTGGEPMLHTEFDQLVEAVLRRAPLTVLTNGILIDADRARRFRALSDASQYTLEFRLSIDGASPAENDPIRGRGTYESILRGASHLQQAGLLPVFTVTTVLASYDQSAGREQFLEHLRACGFARPRVKFIPPFEIGRKARRSGRVGSRQDRTAAPKEFLSPDALLPGEEWSLLCGTSRTVTARGVYPCPILIEESGARLSDDLDGSMHSIELNHSACTTCHREGFSCRT